MEITDIINNKKVTSTFFNLWERWQDESEYEDIADYGKVLAKSIRDAGQPISREKPTKRPFGLKCMINGVDYHLFVKRKSPTTIAMCAKRLTK